MGLFNIFKKSTKPYKGDATNLIYDLLFCDNLDLYKNNNTQPEVYPWNILFSESTNLSSLEKIISDDNIESRVKILVYNKMIANGQKIYNKELFGVIVEIGLENGLDVLASYNDGSARYINQSGKIIVWETTDETSKFLTNKLFSDGANVIIKIGPWDQPRRQAPEKGIARITFLVSDGLYFGEGPITILFDDDLAGPTLASAAELMKYLVEKT